MPEIRITLQMWGSRMQKAPSQNTGRFFRCAGGGGRVLPNLDLTKRFFIFKVLIYHNTKIFHLLTRHYDYSTLWLFSYRRAFTSSNNREKGRLFCLPPSPPPLHFTDRFMEDKQSLKCFRSSPPPQRRPKGEGQHRGHSLPTWMHLSGLVTNYVTTVLSVMRNRYNFTSILYVQQKKVIWTFVC